MAPLFQTILFAADYSECSEAAFRVARLLAHDRETRLIVLHVVARLRSGHQPLLANEEGAVPLRAATEENPRTALAEWLRSLYPASELVRVEYRTTEGRPADELLRVAEEEACDLIVMGTHGRSGVARLLAGSVAEEVLRRGRCPVLTVTWRGPMRARELMAQPVVTVRADTSLSEVVESMLQHRIGCIPVVDEDGKLCGMVTETDFTSERPGAPLCLQKLPQALCEVLSQQAIEQIEKTARTTRAKEVMNPDVVTAEEDTPVHELAWKMLQLQIDHIPIVRDGKPIGIVSRHDLLHMIVREAQREAAAAQRPESHDMPSAEGK
jgi:nucleotide-binding universal stress UspA family protein